MLRNVKSHPKPKKIKIVIFVLAILALTIEISSSVQNFLFKEQENTQFANQEEKQNYSSENTNINANKNQDSLSKGETTPTQTLKPHQEREKVKVKKAVDGDTIQLESGQTVRYIGINTPETKDKRKGVECFGKEAFEKNKELVEGKEIRLEKDVSDKDKYGRLLRYVYVDDIFVNDYLVREGYAYAVTYPPDVKYQTQLKEAQDEARENNRGLWKECKL